MATQTLAEAAKLINNEIVVGVVEDIIDLNPWFATLPFMPYTGQAVLANRENALGDSGVYDVGDTITHKNPATYTQYSFSSTKLIGDAEMDGLVQATSQSAGVDQEANEISSKVKSVGRRYQSGLATDDGSAPNMNSMHSLIDSGQVGTAAANAGAGTALSFELMDEVLDLVVSKNGTVDWMQAAKRTVRSYKALLRALGGTPGDWVMNIPMADGTRRTVVTYEGIPIFRNDYLSIVETSDAAALTGGALTSLWAGVYDDGTRKIGVSGIYPASVPMGIQVQPVGIKETADETIWRVKWYTNFANFNRKGLARQHNINN